MLRLRSDEQLVALFRAGHDEAFRVIHDRYRQRLFAYTRQMLPGSRQDAEDALQDVFVRAFGGLRANDRSLALRAWLYRVAHNRCIDELRRPEPPSPEVLQLVRPPEIDPIAEAEQRESLRRLIADVRRLPDQQRSALLMRELGGMSYNDVSEAMGVSVPAVKSLLVRARVGLAQASEARDTSCTEIREELIVAHDRGVRPTGLARRHMRDCSGCAHFRGELRGTSRQFAAMLPPIGPAAVLAKLLGFGGGSFGFGSGGSAAASGGAVAVGTGGTVASVGVLATGAGHVATLLAAAVVTAGGAVEIQQKLAQPAHHRVHLAHGARAATAAPAAVATSSVGHSTVAVSAAVSSPAPASTAAAPPRRTTGVMKSSPVSPAPSTPSTPKPGSGSGSVPVSTVPAYPSAPGTPGWVPGDGTPAGGPTPPGGTTGTTPGGTPAGPSTPTGPGVPTTSTPAPASGSPGSTTGTTPPLAPTPGSSGSMGTGAPPVTS